RWKSASMNNVRSAFTSSPGSSVTTGSGGQRTSTALAIGIGEWKARWDRARRCMRETLGPREQGAIDAAEQRRNLGWRLYKAHQMHGRWAQPYGFPIQLFGPWTREEGPWKYISDRMLRAHQDHIHVAK